jgi:hypothetical protein
MERLRGALGLPEANRLIYNITKATLRKNGCEETENVQATSDMLTILLNGHLSPEEKNEGIRRLEKKYNLSNTRTSQISLGRGFIKINSSY